LGVCLSLRLIVGPLTAFLMAGLRQQSRLFDKCRELAATGGIKPWIMAIAGGLLFAAVLYALGMLGPWLVTSVLAAGLGVGYYLVIEQSLAQEREKSLDGMRNGSPSAHGQRRRAALRRFIATHSGGNWEEYFEDLFGYRRCNVRGDLPADTLDLDASGSSRRCVDQRLEHSLEGGRKNVTRTNSVP
jgi:hypothetical protein